MVVVSLSKRFHEAFQEPREYVFLRKKKKKNEGLTTITHILTETGWTLSFFCKKKSKINFE